MIPVRFHCFPGDHRVSTMPWYWHLSGRPAQRLAHVPILRRWWRWWVARWLEALRNAFEVGIERRSDGR